MLYPFACANGHRVDQVRAMADRDLPGPCPVDCGLPAWRDVAAQLKSITINAAPLNFYTQWSDVYDVSPREMAHRRGVERYDPTMAHKPEIPRTRIDLPRGIEDVDALIKHIAPVDGQHETDKLRARVAPLPEEGAYV